MGPAFQTGLSEWTKYVNFHFTLVSLSSPHLEFLAHLKQTTTQQTHTHTHTPTPIRSYTHTPILHHTHTPTLPYTHTPTHPHPYAHTHAHTHNTHTHKHTIPYTHTHPTYIHSSPLYHHTSVVLKFVGNCTACFSKDKQQSECFALTLTRFLPLEDDSVVVCVPR
jgi:hypothetical protein